MKKTITPEVGKRYMTEDGWISPPLEPMEGELFIFKAGHASYCERGKTYEDGEDSYNDIVAEYVEPTVTDTFRRDLIARIYVAMLGGCFTLENLKSYDSLGMAKLAIKNADTLIEAMEAQQ